MSLLTLLPLLGLPTALPAEAPPPEPVVEEEPAAVEDAEKPRWTGSVAVGASVSEGNTERRAYNASADAELRRQKDRWTAGLYYNFGEEKTGGSSAYATTEDRSGLKGQYDYFISEKTYFLGQASAETDQQADLDLRWTAGVGVGHQFREDEELKLSAEAGLSYLDEDFGDDSADTGYLAARGAYNVDWKIDEDWTLGHTGVIFPSLEDSDDVSAKLDTRLDVSLTERMFARLQWVWDWDNTPAPGNEESDHRILLNIGWGF